MPAISDEYEADEAEEHEVKILEAREDAPVAFEPSEQALDLVAAPVHPTDPDAKFKTTALGFSGFDIGTRPTLWTHWDEVARARRLPAPSL